MTFLSKTLTLLGLGRSYWLFISQLADNMRHANICISVSEYLQTFVNIAKSLQCATLYVCMDFLDYSV